MCRSAWLATIPEAADFATPAAVEALSIGVQAIRWTQLEHGD